MPIDEFTSVHDSEKKTKVRFLDNQLIFVAGGNSVLSVASAAAMIQGHLSVSKQFAAGEQSIASTAGVGGASSNTILNFNEGNTIYLSLEHNNGVITVDESSLVVGAEYTIVLQQDATGGNSVLIDTLAHAGSWNKGSWSGCPTQLNTFMFSAMPTISTAAGAIDVLTCKCVQVNTGSGKTSKLLSTLTNNFQ